MPPFDITGLLDSAQCEDQKPDVVEWKLTDEDALPEGLTLLGNNTLMDEYPEDEANSKKTKKSNTSKGKKAIPKHKQ